MTPKKTPKWPTGFVSVAEAAILGGVPEATVRGYIERRTIPKEGAIYQKVGRSRLWAVSVEIAIPILRKSRMSTWHNVPTEGTPPPPPVSRGVFAGDEPVNIPPPREFEKLAPPLTPPEKKTEPAAGKNDSDKFVAMKLHREQLAIDKAEMEMKIARGHLLEIDTVGAILSTIAIETRQALLAIPARVGPLVAAEKDPVKVLKMLDEEIAQALENLGKLFEIAPAPAGE